MPLAGDRRAYYVLVSEVMLQQTQVPRVVGAFSRFIDAFPTIDALAAATNTQVLQAWRGMGYNSRALRLRDAARTVVREYGGRFPHDLATLQSIKGIGPYTAAALRNFAFDLPTPCIDTNVRRILHRVFVGPESATGEWRRTDAQLGTLAGKLLLDIGRSESAARDWHGALMDFGSLVCTKRQPRCNVCPLAACCASAGKVPAPAVGHRKRKEQREPGRRIAGVHVPNRIIRGRIVDALRDHPQGLPLRAIGPLVAIDWERTEHTEWLRTLCTALERDGLIVRRGSRYTLS